MGMGGRGRGFSRVWTTVQEPPDLLPGAWLTLLGPGGWDVPLFLPDFHEGPADEVQKQAQPVHIF